ncbi:MAG: hypothetical protein QM534_09705 [Sediminibacterium sp.]|nr:hypothetical protein [Sediminibacterium sp.]
MTKKQLVQDLQTYIGKLMDCETLFFNLCQNADPGKSWKYDLEESDLLSFFSRYSDDMVYKVIIEFENHINAPPFGEKEVLRSILVFKLNPAMLVNEHKPRYDLQDYANGDPARFHILYGDYNYDCFGDVIDPEQLPDLFFQEIYTSLGKAFEKAVLD